MSVSSQSFRHETLISANTIPSIKPNLSFSQYLNCSKMKCFSVWNRNQSRNKVSISASERMNFGEKSNLGRTGSKKCLQFQNRLRVGVSDGRSSENNSESYNFTRKRKVVEHICLLKAKSGLSDKEETDMLDHLYTSQYQMGGIVTISLGRISDQNPDDYTHAVYMRFQRREDLAKFYENSFYLGVLKDHVMPYCHGLISVDYESEVEDDMLAIFRKGEEFNYGVEFMLLISVAEKSIGGGADDALAVHAALTRDFPSLIVQSTQGSNLNLNCTEYTHAAVIRFRSSEAYEMFVGSSEYRDMWNSKFEPITQKTLAVRFPVVPVGTELM